MNTTNPESLVGSREPVRLIVQALSLVNGNDNNLNLKRILSRNRCHYLGKVLAAITKTGNLYTILYLLD